VTRVKENIELPIVQNFAARADREVVADQLAAAACKERRRLIQHARYDWLLLAEGHLTRRLFGGLRNGGDDSGGRGRDWGADTDSIRGADGVGVCLGTANAIPPAAIHLRSPMPLSILQVMVS